MSGPMHPRIGDGWPYIRPSHPSYKLPTGHTPMSPHRDGQRSSTRGHKRQHAQPPTRSTKPPFTRSQEHSPESHPAPLAIVQGPE